MQNSIKSCLFLFTIFIFCNFYNPVLAQIVIDSHEYDTSFGVKHYLYEADNPDGVGFTVDVGNTGGPHHWEFTMEQFPNGDVKEYTVVDPATTPMSAEFPGADHAWLISEIEDSLEMCIYFNKNSTQLSQSGMAFIYGDSSEVYKTDPEEIVLKFPCTLNSSWQNSFANRSGEPGVFQFIDSTSSVVVIDTWGTITIPSGTYNCLRIYKRETEYFLTYVLGTLVSSDTLTYINYDWVAEGVGLLAGIASIDGVTDPNFTKAGHVTLRTNAPTNIAHNQNEIITDFKLSQNYPNPFNPKTKIEYQIPKLSHVDLSIYNLLGQKVATLVSHSQSVGTYYVEFDASSLPGGIYIYKISTNQGFMQSRKLIVIK